MNSSSGQQREDEADKLSALRDALNIDSAELKRREGIPGPLAMEQVGAEFHRGVARNQEAVRREIQKGIDSLDNGRRSSKDEVFARLRARRGR